MKLADLPARPKEPIKIYGLRGRIKDGPEQDLVIFYHHIDGMYSYCTVGDVDGPVTHLSTAMPLEKYKDGYGIVEEKDV